MFCEQRLIRLLLKLEDKTMSRLEELIQQYCPDGVEYKKIKEVYQRIKGTPITAGKMKEIQCPTGEIRIFAGGKTVIDANEIFQMRILHEFQPYWCSQEALLTLFITTSHLPSKMRCGHILTKSRHL